jgi:hypothetical protein
MPICSLVGTKLVKEPQCYARNIDLGGGFLLFQPAVIVIHIIALIMTSIMISHTKFKYTAVGRKEISLFFYMYAATIISEFLVVSGIIPFALFIYPVSILLILDICCCKFCFYAVYDVVSLYQWLCTISIH